MDITPILGVVGGAGLAIAGWVARHYMGPKVPLPGKGGDLAPEPTIAVPSPNTGRMLLDQGTQLLIVAEREKLGGQSPFLEETILNEAKALGKFLDEHGYPRLPTPSAASTPTPGKVAGAILLAFAMLSGLACGCGGDPPKPTGPCPCTKCDCCSACKATRGVQGVQLQVYREEGNGKRVLANPAGSVQCACPKCVCCGRCPHP